MLHRDSLVLEGAACYCRWGLHTTGLWKHHSKICQGVEGALNEDSDSGALSWTQRFPSLLCLPELGSF